MSKVCCDKCGIKTNRIIYVKFDVFQFDIPEISDGIKPKWLCKPCYESLKTVINNNLNEH